MILNHIKQSISDTLPFIWVAIMYNCFGIKLLVETGQLNILGPYTFFHFISTCLMSLFFKKKNAFIIWKKTILLSLTGLPILFFSVYLEQISIANIVVYFLFLFAILAGFTNLTFNVFPSNNYQRLFGFILFAFLWGITIIFESIPGLFNLLSPLTISYHYLLIMDGIFHLSTLLYSIIFIIIFLKGYYEAS